MKKKLFALAIVPVLCLSALQAFAAKEDPSLKYANSDAGSDPVSGVIKKCTTGTLFKNVDPFISGGNPDAFPVVRSETFLVDGKEIELTVTWDFDNSFFYGLGVSDVNGNLINTGVMHEIGVENNSDKIIYKYASPVQGDSGLNKLLPIDPPSTAEKANHIDICISPLDAVAPDVSIRVEPSTIVGTTINISGEVFIIAEVEDESDVNLTITIVRDADNTDVTPAFSTPTESACQLARPDCTAYTWGPWDTTNLVQGEYTITIDATDTSAIPNDATQSVTVTVGAQNCLEGADGVPDNEVGIGGCNLTGFQIVELPNELDGLLDGKTISQVAVRAILQSDTCGGPEDANGNRPFEFVAQDPRVDPITGEVILQGPLDLSTVFNVNVSNAPSGLSLRADTVGSPCLTLIFGDANFSFKTFYQNGAPLQGTGVYNYAVTQLPGEVPGMETLDEVGPLQPDLLLDGYQPDLQFVPQATYSPDDQFLLVENEASPFTFEVFNPQRKRTPDFSWFLLNTREVCLNLDPALDPSDGTPYYEAVLQCKIDLAVEYFDNLEQAVIEAGPNLLDPTVNNLLTDVNKARSMVKVRFWDKAIADLTALRDQVVGGQWIVDERNDPGILIMRIENLFFRIEQLALAESALP